MADTNTSTVHVLDQNGLLYVWQKIKTLLGNKVDKITGYSLISDSEITRLASVINYDDTDIQASISDLNTKVEALEKGTYDDTALRKWCNDTFATIASLTNYAKSSEIPTKVSVLDNDSNYQTAAQVNSSISTSLSGYAKSTDIPTNNNLLTNGAGYLTSTLVGTAITSALNGYAKTTDIPTDNASLTNGAGYQTASNVSTAITNNNASYYTKTEIDAKVSSAIHYKGTVATYADLPTENMLTGDLYNVQTADATHGIKAGDNVVWDGSAWDVQSGTVDLSNYIVNTDTITNSEIDTIFAS